MSKQSIWKPTFIDIETEFTKFVCQYRGGQKVEDFVTNVPKRVLNADFVFSNDNVIGELKCLKNNSTSEKRAERLVKSYIKEGYSGSDLFGYVWRGETMPLPYRPQ